MPHDNQPKPSLFSRLYQRALFIPFLEEERKSLEGMKGQPDKIHWKIIGIFVVVALSLTLIEYFGKERHLLGLCALEASGAGCG